MKKILLNSTILLALTTAGFTANANSKILLKKGKKIEISNVPSAMNVKFVGFRDGYAFIQITAENNSGYRAFFSITDNDGEVLYRDNVDSTGYSLTIKMDPREVNEARFKLENRDMEISRAYSLTSRTHTSFEFYELTGK